MNGEIIIEEGTIEQLIDVVPLCAIMILFKKIFFIEYMKIFLVTLKFFNNLIRG